MDCGCAQGHGCCEEQEERSCCGCEEQDSGRLHRRFRSRDEQIARLQQYRGDLQEELKAVEERLAALRAVT
jgi:hypothetical protein